MKKRILVLILTLFLGFGTVMFAGCKLSSRSGNKNAIIFIVDNAEYSRFETSGNELVAVPEDPTKEGYTFDGWFVDENYENKFTVGSYLNDELKEDVCVYAKFSINKYTISFNTNCNLILSPITQEYSSVVIRPNNPTRVGYTFGGWYTDNGTFLQEYTFSTMPLNGITLHAKWVAHSYELRYHLNGGVNGNNPATYTIESSSIVIQDATKSGYLFEGWYTEPEFINKIEIINTKLLGDYDLYAKYVVDAHTITFNSNGGTPVSEITQSYNSVVTRPADPTRRGYTFGGWYTDNNTFTNKYTFSTMPLNGIRLYAKWTLNTYTINYRLDGGESENNPTSYTVNSELITLEDAVKTGYTFEGWFTEQAFINRIETIDPSSDTLKNYTLYAKFGINQYTINFVPNGGPAVGSITKGYGDAVIKPTDPVWAGYSFGGWYTDDGTFKNEYTFSTMPLGGITLYAKWSIKTFFITYQLDGGINGKNPLCYDINTKDIMLQDPTKTGYAFGGWYIDNMYTEEIFVIDTASLRDYTLYAKFTINKYTISFVSNGGEVIAPITQDYKTAVTKPIDPIKNGYDFAGWYTDNGTFLNKFTFTTMPLNGVTLYAKWVKSTEKPIKITQVSTNYINDKLSDVKLSCDAHQDCSIVWENPDEVLTNAHGYYYATHTPNGGESTRWRISVSAIPTLDSNRVFQGMIFTLDEAQKKATVRANSDTLVEAIIPEKVRFGGNVYTVVSLEYQAFYDIDTLEYIYIPKTITYFGGTACAHNDNLVTADLDEELTILGTQLFMYCSSLVNVTIPDGVTTIPSGLFYSCSSIKSVNIPNGVTIIDSTAFYGTALTQVDLPEGIYKIGDNAFTSIDIKELTIPSTVAEVGVSAFAYVNTLEKLIVLSEDITFGLKAFDGCSALREIYLSAAGLVNSISSDTKDTSCILGNLRNNDILYINSDIVVTSPYISEMFSKVESLVEGYNAYTLGKYTELNVTNFENRVYAVGAGLYGDEKISIKDPNDQTLTIPITSSMIEFFDTATVGKKVAKITYKYNVITKVYYVLPTVDSQVLNCISQVNNFSPSYYVAEDPDLSKVSLRYHYNSNGYMVYSDIPVTEEMMDGFNTATAGIRFVIFTKDNCSSTLRYYVTEAATEKVTSESFVGGIYYDKDTTEETDHFIITIEKGSYLAQDYKEIIEKIYAIQQKVTGLNFESKINIDVNDTNYPSCGATTLYLNPTDLLFNGSTAFVHELGHALDHSQVLRRLPTTVLTEGYATYVEYLTAREAYLTDPELYSRIESISGVLADVDGLGSRIYLYDFENYILNLDRDELVGNSQYEVGCKFFAYLDYRFGDFCSWMANEYNATDFEQWKENMKIYYEDENLFSDIYKYHQAVGDRYQNFLGVDFLTNTQTRFEFAAGHKFNYYFNFASSKDYQGYIHVNYKDLYANVDSARAQLDSKGVEYDELYLKTLQNVVFELYDADGNLLRTEMGSGNKFSLEGVSFFKISGAGEIMMYLTYE